MARTRRVDQDRVVGAVSMDPCRGVGEVDTGTTVITVPVSDAGGGPASREAFQRIRQPSPLALFSFIHFPNCGSATPRRANRHNAKGRVHTWQKSSGVSGRAEK